MKSTEGCELTRHKGTNTAAFLRLAGRGGSAAVLPKVIGPRVFIRVAISDKLALSRDGTLLMPRLVHTTDFNTTDLDTDSDPKHPHRRDNNI